MSGKSTRSPVERMTQKIQVTEQGCYEFMGARNDRGYGQVWAHGRLVYTHRFARELCNGPIPDGGCILQRCDNPPCCNPDHLFLGSLQDNAKDMMQKGRGRGQFKVGKFPTRWLRKEG